MSPSISRLNLGLRAAAMLLAAALLVGCAGTHPKGVSKVDEFDAVQVDQMSGNSLSSSPLQKVVVCLNARRETRQVTAITNVTVTPVTNAITVAATNEIISITTNYLVTAVTNLAPLAAGAVAPLTGEAAAAAAATVTAAPATAGGDGAAAVGLTNAGPQLTTNVAVSVARNTTATAGPNQRGSNTQVVRTYNNQLTTQSNNLSVSLMTNLVVTAETNATVNYSTNLVIGSVTNVVITATNLAVHDYFLYTEVVAPGDFVLQTGESLVLLVDGVRHGLTTTTTPTPLISRKGFATTLYRATPELLVAIANAREVRVRIKGNGSVIERTMNEASRRNFKTYLVRHFGAPEPAPAGGTAAVGTVSNPVNEIANLR